MEAAQELGIRTIYQELSLFSTLSVAENIFIHNEIAYRDSKWMIAPLASKETVSYTHLAGLRVYSMAITLP